MPTLKIRLLELNQHIDTAWDQLSIAEKIKQLQKLDDELANSDVWHDPEAAGLKTKQAASLRSQIEPWQTLRTQAADMEELLALDDKEGSLFKEFEHQLSSLENDLQK